MNEDIQCYRDSFTRSDYRVKLIDIHNYLMVTENSHPFIYEDRSFSDIALRGRVRFLEKELFQIRKIRGSLKNLVSDDYLNSLEKRVAKLKAKLPEKTEEKLTSWIEHVHSWQSPSSFSSS